VSALSRTLKDAADQIDMKDLAWTLQSRRAEFPFRATFSADSKSELVDKLDAYIAETHDASETISVSPKFPLRVLGIFTGQGAQWHRMGVGLFEQSSVFRDTIEQLDESLASLRDPPSWSLADVMVSRGNESRVHEAEFAQPLTTALQIALVDLLRSTDIALDAVVGHSSGEIAAAYASGYLSSSDAIRVAYYRGFHSSLAKSPVNGEPGSMLAVGITLNDATNICQRAEFLGRIAVAAHNSPSNVTLSGDSDAILEVKALLDHQGAFTRVLKINKAYHSHHAQPCADVYLESMKQCMIKPLRTYLGGECSWYSSVYGPDGRSIHDPDALRGRYWIENMVNPVLFHHAVERAVREEVHCFDLALEIGPHPTLQRPVTDTLRAVTGVNIPYIGVLSRWKSDTVAFSDALGFIWTRVWDPIGSPSIISWQALRKALSGNDETRQPRLLKNLPSYNWDHEKPLFFESSTSNSWRTSHRKM
jgi:hybrid polyketide synthase/nonribosomal peptide synthetase ACE1